MPDGERELISRRARSAFRDLASGVFVSALHEYWRDEGFAPFADPGGDSGVRRRIFDGYAAQVDWRDYGQVDRALRVFEHLLRHFHREERFEDSTFDDVREYLADDGFRLDERYRIQWINPPGLEQRLRSITDPSGIRIELERARRSASSDPAQAIGAAKQLIEATARVVLLARGVTVDQHATVPVLVKKAQEALHLHVSQVAAGSPDGVDALKKVLGGVSAIAIGIGELRNLGYGTGHGQPTLPAGLGERHAHLAVNAASTWCQLLLDTLADSKAPWQRGAPPTASGAQVVAAPVVTP
ncbi:abortive infection family protein [Dactylosporangium sp. CA-233914]|uniref:abortive infection family protein n=1 Tax=Dactylosporangium sp. CA-233914 TaxID=3239934 RepID=UPI003D8A5B12